jgi:pimeloyl-ACP methyl ester carboxylesterase
VLVGHSAGGVYVRAFAAAYPRDVAGLVLVDSSALDQGTALGLASDAAAFAGVAAKARRCRDTAAAGDTGERAAGCAVAGDAVATWSARLAEIEALAAPTAAERAADLAPVRVPVVVLSAGRRPPEAARAWGALHARMAAAGPGGELRVVDSGHLMMRDAPGAVADAVLAVVAKVRR